MPGEDKTPFLDHSQHRHQHLISKINKHSQVKLQEIEGKREIRGNKPRHDRAVLNGDSRIETNSC